MAWLCTGEELNHEIKTLINSAKNELILISPYIKLHEDLKAILNAKRNHDTLSIVIVFGKNEDDLSKSFFEDDFIFFCSFPNIEIRYEKRLHAKFYANDSTSIITSMNLYGFSMDNNVEFGVISESKGILDNLAQNLLKSSSLDHQAIGYASKLIKESELIFKREPYYESKGLFSTRYAKSLTKVDRIEEFFPHSGQQNRPSPFWGYCIRTGKKIPFNPQKPFSEESYQLWAKFANKDYPEKYCHFSGESSNGETAFSKPILSKNWKKAKETFKF
jgi:hypothetical protein